MSRPFLAGGALLAFVQAAPALAQGQIEGAAALRDAVEEEDVVRVIATVRAPPAAASIETPEVAAAKARLADDMRAADVRLVEPLPGLPLVVVEVDRDGLQRLLESGEVVAVQEDVPEQAHLAQSGPIVHGPEAWAVGARGGGTLIAILDTGVDANHAFLAGKVIAEACFSTTSALQGSTLVCPAGTNQQIGAGAGQPCAVNGCDHGTHVAGIAAGRNASFSGMAPDAGIVAIQVFSRFDDRPGGPTPCANVNRASPCVLTFPSDQLRALGHVRDIAAARGIVAVNMSLGGGRNTSACNGDVRQSIIQTLRGMGVTTVISSGNDGFIDAVGAPGCIPEAITVGSTTKSDVVSGFSNSAAMIDLLAPGTSIRSSVPGGGFAFFDGTSMAAPHVAGAIATLRSSRPHATADQLEDALEASGQTVTDARNQLARPRINIAAALFTLPSGWKPFHALDERLRALDVGRNADGRLEVFGVASDDTIWHTWQTGPSSGWNNAWVPFHALDERLRSLDVGQNADGRLEVFGVASDDTIWHTWQTDANNGWNNEWVPFHAPDERLRDLRVGRNKDGRLEVFGVAPDDTIWHTWQTAPNNGWNNEWVPFHALDERLRSLDVGQNADGRLEVFGVASDGTIWHTWQTSPNNGWNNEWVPFHALDERLRELRVGRNQDGRLEVFGVAPDDTIWHTWQTSPNNGWNNAWVPFHALDERLRSLEVGQNADGRLEVFGVASDDTIWHTWQTGPNNGWNNAWVPFHALDERLRSLDVGRNADGRLEVFGVASDDTIWHTWQTSPNNGWNQ